MKNSRQLPSAALTNGWIKKPINGGAYQSWLLDNGSLTLRLQAQNPNFTVIPVRQYRGKPAPDEVRILHLASRQNALMRDVYLSDSPILASINPVPSCLSAGAQPVCALGNHLVFAHSVLPDKSLSGTWRYLAQLGNKPLGGALFSDHRVCRTPLCFKKLSRQHVLYRRAIRHLAEPPAVLWARRSLFTLNHAAILVTEIFLPAVLGR